MPGLVRSLLAATAFAVMCGCAQTGRLASPLALFRKPEPEKKAEAEPAPFKPEESKEKEPEKTAEVAAATPPTAKPDEVKPEEKQEPPATPETAAATANPAEPPKAETAKSPLTHDAETLALIEDELQHTSPGDRAKLYEEFKSLDGEMVRQLIRINRMVRDLEASRTAATEPAPAASSATASPPAAAGPALASAGSEPASRVLNLGGTAATAPPIANADAAILVDARPEIRPTGHDAPMTAPAVRTAAAVGHSTTRPVPVLEAVAGDPAAGGSTAAGSASEAWSAQLRQLIAVAEARAEQARAGFLDQPAGGPLPGDAARKAYAESQVHLRLLYLMAGEQARAMQAIPGLDAADQEFWQQVLWGLSNYFDEAALPNRADRASQTVEQLRTAIARLQGEANLSLRNVAFCHKITSFGNYEKFERDEYQPGQSVLLYAEVVNFKSVPQPSDGLYQTQLKSTIEFYRAGEGQPVHKVDFEPTTDLCRSYRQDYFHSYEMKIPSTLTLGPHVLKLTAEDLQTGKLATYSVNFTVK